MNARQFLEIWQPATASEYMAYGYLVELIDADARLKAYQDMLITKMWVGVDEGTPANDLTCDVRYQNGQTGYALYEAGIGFTDCFPDISETITHWKPAPQAAE